MLTRRRWTRILSSMLWLIYLSIECVTLLTTKAHAFSELHVTISGLRSNSGNVHIALYDDPKKFPDPNGMILDIEVDISERTARHSFAILDEKYYAIAVYHDANDNNTFDQGLLGFPLEDYAFSNNAKVFIGPPSFSDAAFNLSEKKEIFIQIDN